MDIRTSVLIITCLVVALIISLLLQRALYYFLFDQIMWIYDITGIRVIRFICSCNDNVSYNGMRY